MIEEQAQCIVTVECTEEGQKVLRNVNFSSLTLGKLKAIYDRIQDFDVLFNVYVKGDMDAFIRAFLSLKANGEPQLNGLVWEVDDVGIVFLCDIEPGFEATVHFCFWDRRFLGREKLMTALLKHFITTFGLHRVVAEVPRYATFYRKAVERLGFEREGCKRQAVRYKGEWFDLLLYGILESEVT